MIKVAVLGAAGKMGQEVCGAVLSDSELELVAAVDPSAAGSTIASDLVIESDLNALQRTGAQVAVDFTHPEVVLSNVLCCLEAGVHVVVGTTGLGDEDLKVIEKATQQRGSNVFVAPNFAIGAVLMMEFAKEAARFFDRAEIIELHHDQKVDAPSGTAIRTARLMAAQRGNWPTRPDSVESIESTRGGLVGGVRIHSVRLPGLIAHQEVILGTAGQTLTIRHDSTDRSSFMPGVLLAIKAVGERAGLTVGLEHLLGF